MATSAALPTLDGVTNFRELGGLPAHGGRAVRPGVLFRSGHWGRASARDLAELERLGIRVVIDFRNQQDVAHEGADRLPEGVDYVALPMGDPAGTADVRTLILERDLETLRKHFGDGRAEQYMTQAAATLVTERSDNYAAFLQRLAEPGCPPVLFHCSAGKDRAGWAASLLLFALGVEEGPVIEHYLLSNKTFDLGKLSHEFPRLDPELASLFRPLGEVREAYLRASTNAALERYGSLEGYLREGLELGEAQQQQLRRNWLA